MPIEILKPPQVAVLKTDGINCDEETSYAFEKAGARTEIIHLNQLQGKEKSFADFQIVVIPGGFSYGDDIASGRVMAIELQTQFADMLLEHAQKERFIIGICNGFQVLLQTGLLPFGEMVPLDKIRASLTTHNSGKFESRWVYISPQMSVCPFVVTGEPLRMPVAHGEGKFVTKPETLSQLEQGEQITFRYARVDGSATMDYPANPNGSCQAVAAICDPKGRIFGMMPHPERNVEIYHDPNFRRKRGGEPDGLKFIRNIIKVARES
jgi:phosphoribosylformylglycinamidine synthase